MKNFFIFLVMMITTAIFGKTIDISSLTLENGLRVYLHKDDKTPTVALALYYDIGSRDEEAGKTGFAHLFEHMMFQGSRNVDKGEHFKFIENNGGEANATTSKERTEYFQILPSNQLELALWLEADRMTNLLVTELNFQNQLDVVKEEKKSNYNNRPYGKMFLTLDNMSYEDFAYQHSTIGSMEDLDKATVDYAVEFYKKYYTPNNAVLVISGDFEKEEAEKLVKKYFEKIPSGEKKAVKTFKHTTQLKSRKETIKDELAKLPAVALAYRVPPAMSDDFFPLVILEQILISNESSRLHQILVKDKAVALSIGGGINLNRGPNLFYFYSIMKKDKVEEVKSIIENTLKDIQTKGITPEELERAKTRLKTEFMFKMESNLNKARTIGTYALYFNKPEFINEEYQRYENVTAEMVQEVAKKYFKDTQKNELNVIVQ